jgi:hypothetical protein
MLKENEILEATKLKLKTIYDYPVYLDDVKENFQAPCFFLKLIRSIRQDGLYTNYNTCTLYIDYFPEYSGDDGQLERYEVKDNVVELFYNGLQVADRHIKFGTISATTVGQDSDIIEISLPFSYYDAIQQNETDWKIGEIHQSGD